jgi:hypothetical protein
MAVGATLKQSLFRAIQSEIHANGSFLLIFYKIKKNQIKVNFIIIKTKKKEEKMQIYCLINMQHPLRCSNSRTGHIIYWLAAESTTKERLTQHILFYV